MRLTNIKCKTLNLHDKHFTLGLQMAICETKSVPTPRVQCSTRKDAEKLEQILQKIKQGDAITGITRMGTVVYVHLVDEKIE